MNDDETDDDLPMIFFGDADTEMPFDPSESTDPDPDDEELPETPQNVLDILGFDPLDFEHEDPQADDVRADASFVEGDHPRDNDGKFASGGGGGGKSSHPTVSFNKRAKPPASLNGIGFAKWQAPTDKAGWAKVAGQNHSLKEPPLPPRPKGKGQSAGVIIREDDGRVWLFKPTNAFGGYEHTFPKGGVEPGLSMQATAIKEAYEESGLQVEITGYAADIEKSTSMNRYYYARRVGGTPEDAGEESEGVVLASADDLGELLNTSVDRKLANQTLGIGGKQAQAAPLLKVSELSKVGGKLGSNPGGRYESKSGKRYYVKESKSAAHAKNEVTASKLYQLAGSPVLNVSLADMGGGKLGTATDWQSVKNIDRHNAEQRKASQENFATHAWLANWDAVGLEYDNQGTIDGKMATLDTGGALLFRAQGGPKGEAFGDKATEWATLRNPSNQQAHRIFGDMSPAQLQQSARKVADIPDAKIRAVVDEFGPGDAKDRTALADKLIARKADIAKRAGVVRADASFVESEHPRDPDGKFSSGGGGGGGKANKAAIAKMVNSMPKYGGTGSYGSGIEQIAWKGLEAGDDPALVADKIKMFVSAFKHSSISGFGNAVIAQIETAYDLKKGSLGKALAKGKGQYVPAFKPGATPAQPAPAAPVVPTPTSAKPATVPGPGSSKGPAPFEGSAPQNEVYALATGEGTAAEKIEKIKNHPAVVSYPSGFTAKFAQQWVEALGGKMGVPASPAATPAKPAAPAAKPAGTVDPSTTVYSAPDTKRIQKLRALFDTSKRVPNTHDPHSPKIAPSLGKGFWAKASAEAKQALKDYADGHYDDINNALRGHVTAPSKSTTKMIADIEELYDEDEAVITEDCVMHRGEGELPKEEMQKYIAQLKAGIPCRYMKTGYISTSLASHAAFHSRPVQLEMVVRKGVRGLGIDTISPHSENEVLLKHGTSFEIIEIRMPTKSDPRTRIKMVAIGAG